MLQNTPNLYMYNNFFVNRQQLHTAATVTSILEVGWIGPWGSSIALLVQLKLVYFIKSVMWNLVVLKEKDEIRFEN